MPLICSRLSPLRTSPVHRRLATPAWALFVASRTQRAAPLARGISWALRATVTEPPDVAGVVAMGVVSYWPAKNSKDQPSAARQAVGGTTSPALKPRSPPWPPVSSKLVGLPLAGTAE